MVSATGSFTEIEYEPILLHVGEDYEAFGSVFGKFSLRNALTRLTRCYLVFHIHPKRYQP